MKASRTESCMRMLFWYFGFQRSAQLVGASDSGTIEVL